MASDWTPENEQNFAVSTKVLTELKASLPAKVEATKTSQKAKLPFFTTCLQKLGSWCLEQFLYCALLEAVALIVLLDQRVREAIVSGDMQKLDVPRFAISSWLQK